LPEYKTSSFMHLTGGSTSTKEAYLPLRVASASAREMLVAAAALDWSVPATECRTEAGTVIHDRSNRRAGYGDLTLKAARLSVPSKPALKPRSQFKLIGKRNLRVDSRAKVEGTAKFGMDVVVPNMVRALVIHGPVYGAEAKAIRADAAKKMPGILGVLAVTRGVAVVAEKYWQALAAAPLVEVDWSAGDVAGLDTAKMRAAAHAFKDKGEPFRSEGNVDKAIGRAQIKIEAIYDVPYLAHAPMEPQNCTVHVKGDQAEVWAPCQSPSILQAYVSDALGISQNDVLVHTTFIGGGFGRRLVADWAVQAALISRAVGRPAQVIWSREDDMTQAFYRPQGTAHIRGAVSADRSTASAIAVHLISQSIALDTEEWVRGATAGVPRAVQSILSSTLTGMVGSNTVPDLFAGEGLANTPYTVENLDMTFTPIMSKLPITSWRSVGNSVTGFLMEGFVDELARAAKQDPYAFRRRMLKADSRQIPVLDAVARLAKWGEKKPGVGRGIARHFSFDSEVAEVVDVEIVNGRIKVRRVWAAVDCGIAVNPDIVRQQVEGSILFGLSAALDQEITIVNGVVQQTNFDAFPVLRMHECPEITVEVLDIDREPTGIGEPGLPPIAPAVANAIFDLTGIRLRRLPLQAAYDEARKS
ncbi:MAG: aldehyde oxidase and xanthine dehydrogenase molybdopterin binding protein, partial [Myxococcaceae bacterium]|nr:aldehyde oxidase and xanthine dehydrogenase molybdopterin binding protein [Myxococcaceae bacterium]